MLDYLISRVAVADVLVDSVRTGSVQARIVLALVDVDLTIDTYLCKCNLNKIPDFCYSNLAFNRSLELCVKN